MRGRHPLAAEIWSSEKVDLGGSESTSRTVLLVDQSSSDFFGRTREESLSIRCFFPDFRCLHPFRRYLRWQFEVEVDSNFAHFWLPTFLGEGPPKFWDRDYHAEEPSDHVAKFRGDRPTELGDLVSKIKKEEKHME